MIELSDITVAGASGATAALDGVTLRIEAGEFVVLAGRNGCGKSTLARVLAGLVQPQSGRVARAPTLGVGLVLQDPAAQLLAPTVERDVAYGLESRQAPPPVMVLRVADLVRRLRLEQVAWRDPRTLSGGQQQRVAIAGVLAVEPAMLVLDEPTSQLDASSAARLRELVRALHADGVTVVWVTQDAAELSLATRVVVLDAGRVAWQGPPRDLVADAGLLEALGVPEPPSARLARLVRERVRAGHSVPAALTDAELVAALSEGRR